MSGFGSRYVPPAFKPSQILPEQFYSRPRVLRFEGIRLLVTEVLRDGIECFLNYCRSSDRQQNRLFREAADWIFNETDRPFSFENICEALDLHPGYLRKKLRRLEQEGFEALAIANRHVITKCRTCRGERIALLLDMPVLGGKAFYVCQGCERILRPPTGGHQSKKGSKTTKKEEDE